ncbi:MAG: PepSY domain-containing protein [Acidimicrobiia bacterium]
MRIRSLLLVTATAAVAATGGVVATRALDDPDAVVAPISLSGISAAAEVTTPDRPAGGTAAGNPTAPAGDRTVEVAGLEQLVGTLRPGEDPDDWYVGGVEVDVGPEGWISAAPAFEDYDGDGTAEPLLTELQGLAGRAVTLGVRYELDDDGDDDRDDADVFTIEGLVYRDPAGAAAPWQAPPSGVEASRDQVVAAAEAAVGAGAAVREVERENEDGWLGWDVEVRAPDGREYQVYVDLGGTVVDVRADDT